MHCSADLPFPLGVTGSTSARGPHSAVPHCIARVCPAVFAPAHLKMCVHSLPCEWKHICQWDELIRW